MDVTSYIEGGYGAVPAGCVEEHNANQSQYHTTESTKKVGKRKKLVAPATG